MSNTKRAGRETQCARVCDTMRARMYVLKAVHVRTYHAHDDAICAVMFARTCMYGYPCCNAEASFASVKCCINCLLEATITKCCINCLLEATITKSYTNCLLEAAITKSYTNCLLETTITVLKLPQNSTTLYCSLGRVLPFVLDFKLALRRLQQLERADLHNGQSCFLKASNGIDWKTVLQIKF